MPGPRQTITDIMRQQQRWLREQSRSWASLSMPAAVAEQERIDVSEAGLTEVADFGSNPGALRMLVHLPENLPPDAPLVVVLHGCTQSAAEFDRACGWSGLTSQAGFALLLPEQRPVNNSKGCFNWFAANDTRRDAGEVFSIRRMIDWMLANHDLDPNRVFVTGLSNGWSLAEIPPDNKQVIRRKTLQLNFRKLGDRYFQHSGEIRFAPPEQWLYRTSTLQVAEGKAPVKKPEPPPEKGGARAPTPPDRALSGKPGPDR